MSKVYDLTADDVGYNGVTKRDIGKKMIVRENGCVDIIKPYEQLTRSWIGHYIVLNGGRYSHVTKDDEGNMVFYCDVLPDDVGALFPQAKVIHRGDYVRSKLVFPKNTRLTVKRTKWKGAAL